MNSKTSKIWAMTIVMLASLIIKMAESTSSIIWQENYSTLSKIGDEFQVNSYTLFSQGYPRAANLTNGGFVVVWQSRQGDGSDYGVFGQLFDRNANKVGGQFQINTNVSNLQAQPSVAGLTSGNRFVVTWHGYQRGNSDIYAQIFDNSGNKIGKEFRVNTNTVGDQLWPYVIGLKNGNFVITWVDDNYSDGNGLGVYGQLFNNNGYQTGVSNQFLVNTYTTSLQEFARSGAFLSPGSSGGFVVVWMSYGNDGSSWGVFGQLFDQNAKKVGSQFQVNTYTSNTQSVPSVAVLASNAFVVAWESYSLTDADVSVQRFTADGTMIGYELDVNFYTSGYQGDPTIAALPSGHFVVSWSSCCLDSSDTGVYAQVFDGAYAVGRSFRVNTYTTSFQNYSNVITLSNGNFLITWQSFGQDGSYEGIFAQMFQFQMDGSDSSNSLSLLVLIGIVCGAVLLTAIIVVAIYFGWVNNKSVHVQFKRKKKKKKKTDFVKGCKESPNTWSWIFTILGWTLVTIKIVCETGKSRYCNKTCPYTYYGCGESEYEYNCSFPCDWTASVSWYGFVWYIVFSFVAMIYYGEFFIFSQYGKYLKNIVGDIQTLHDVLTDLRTAHATFSCERSKQINPKCPIKSMDKRIFERKPIKKKCLDEYDLTKLNIYKLLQFANDETQNDWNEKRAAFVLENRRDVHQSVSDIIDIPGYKEKYLVQLRPGLIICFFFSKQTNKQKIN
ncbi:hypothetical protein RFI_38085 [Reticulomyxa filosa]|uniref:Uncharacterized protein n=1 Tax=Reticulomyxa filosa TaxID=46433 RepID=X6LE77_RETFI|nr:hypothetical protein RFI_38085 [Reticulomyxa filosa]|eukprot:ETN99396.1 hypothetical protein RFI_38085 [Reticulomyxa filosa]